MRSRGKGISGVVLILIALVIVLALIAAAYVGNNGIPGLAGSGNVVSKQFTVQGFTAVQVEDGFNVNITYADYFMVRVTTDDNMMGHVNVTSANGTLCVGASQGVSLSRATVLRIEISMPAITGIDFSVNTKGVVSGFPMQTRLSMLLSNSTLNLTQAYVGSFAASLSSGSLLSGHVTCGGGVPSSMMLSGGSSVSLTGIGGDMTIDASGGSSLELLGMAANDVTAVLSGGSSARVNMDGTLNADLSGGSSLRYSGSPTMGNINPSGGSSIEPL